MPRAKKQSAEPTTPATYPQRLGDQIRRRRLAKEMSQDDLAERAGVSAKYVGEIERGAANPTTATIGRLAHALDWNGLDPLPDAEASSLSAEDRAFRNDLIKRTFPVALAAFYRSGGAGAAWSTYEDLASSVSNAVGAVMRIRST